MPEDPAQNMRIRKVLMEEADEAEAATRARSPEYRAPGSRTRSREPRERSPVHKSYYTEDYKPTQLNKVVSYVAKVTEGRKRSKDKCSQMARRGRPRRQSRSLEHQEQETTDDMRRGSS